MKQATDGLIGIGFSHLLAPVACRERATVPEASAGAVMRELSEALGAREIVLLSTCSRLEVYAVAEHPAQALERARRWFIARAGAEIAPCLTPRSGHDVLGHLFLVAAGLDSWIIGESEILGQVKRAYEAARSGGFTGPVLNRVFQSAAAAGKAARAKTGIQQGVASIGGASALLARSIFGERQGGATVVFGAGEAAQATVRHLAAKSFAKIFVANRTVERAEALGREFGGLGIGFEEGLNLLSETDIAVFSVNSAEPVLTSALLRKLIAGRNRPLFLLDLGMPRNVEPACASVGGVYLYNLDDLKGVVARSIAGKSGEREKAGVIVAEAAVSCAAELEKAEARRVRAEASTTTNGTRGTAMKHEDTQARRLWALIGVGAIGLCLSAALGASAQEAPPKAEAKSAGGFVGAESCMTCHEGQGAAVKSSAHGVRLEKIKGVAFEKSCETCHGAGETHASSSDAKDIFNPGKALGEKASETCLSCHASDHNRIFWAGSAHEGKGNSCVSCHKVHGGNESLMSKKTESELCLSCHKDVKSDLMKRSKHPMRDAASKSGEGKMNCSSCHNPHGARGEKLIGANSINDKCYECHNEKKAALLWEHAPVKEDCMTCHSPHGSSNDKMLTMKVPRLCQSCHMQGRHQTGTLATNSIYAASRSCLTCHSMVHGSNHPSGTVLQR